MNCSARLRFPEDEADCVASLTFPLSPPPARSYTMQQWTKTPSQRSLVLFSTFFGAYYETVAGQIRTWRNTTVLIIIGKHCFDVVRQGIVPCGGLCSQSPSSLPIFLSCTSHQRLVVCKQDYTKTAKLMSTKFCGGIGHEARKNAFGAYLDKRADPGVSLDGGMRSPSSFLLLQILTC